MPARLSLLLLLPLALTACDPFGNEEATRLAAAKDAEGRAVGSGCRHSGRALEACYQMNPKAPKASVFAGWRDMDGYMRENKIDVVAPAATDNDKAAETGEPAPGVGKPADAKATEGKPGETRTTPQTKPTKH